MAAAADDRCDATIQGREGTFWVRPDVCRISELILDWEVISNYLPLGLGAYRGAATDAKEIRVSRNILMVRRADNGGPSSEGTRSTLTGDDDHSGTDLVSDEGPVVYCDDPVVKLDNQAHVSVTGNFAVYKSLYIPEVGVDLVGFNGDTEPTYYAGTVRFGRFKLNNVHFNPSVGNVIIVSGSELDKLGYFLEIGRGQCIVTDLRIKFPWFLFPWTSKIVGEGHLIDDDYVMHFLEIPENRTSASVLGESEEPTLVTSLRKAGRSVWHGFTGPLFRRVRASAETLKRPSV